MKKICMIIFPIIFILLFSSCGLSKTNQNADIENINQKDKVNLKNVKVSNASININKELNDEPGVSKEPVILSGEIALKYAYFIVSQAFGMDDYSVNNSVVSFDKEKNIWKVYFYIDEAILGGDISIYFKNTGEVIGSRSGE